MEPSLIGQRLDLQTRLVRPLWGTVGGWAVVCGALASNALHLQREDLLPLALALVLGVVAWGCLWDLTAGGDWFRLLAGTWPPRQPAALRGLPYTQRRAPAGRLLRGLNRLLGWGREALWPAASGMLFGILAAALLAVVVSLLLPAALRPLNAALVALLGLGLATRRRGAELLAGEALAVVGLCWLAGHLALAPLEGGSALLALCFALSAWGLLRLARGRPRALPLLNGGQVAAAALLAVLRQPLPAVLLGLLLLGQVALQPPLRAGADPAQVARRTWPWLLAAMLAAALALP